jgi:CrcB protein
VDEFFRGAGTVTNILAVAVGGAAGSLLRYWLGGQVQAASQSGFPFGTLAVNVLGSFTIGFAYFWLAERHSVGSPGTELIFVGLLGGFTTFSSFSLETLALLLQGQAVRAVVYIAASISLCLMTVWFGYRLGHALSP